ncbi:MAG: hypothetical protein MI746_13570 [Pseudomonadales bacterium]|nr:hypothetical protein [Pseudomonadales bacterium]
MTHRTRLTFHHLFFTTYFLLGATALPIASFAQDDFFNTIDIDIENQQGDSGPVEFFGWVTQKVAYGLEAPGPLFARSDREINKIETTLYGQLDIAVDEQTAFRFSTRYYHDEVYRWFDDNPHTEDEINTFRNLYQVRDFYVEHQTDNGIYFKLGNQLLVWGQSEYLRVTDLINVEDQFNFAQQDLENLRLQVPALLVSFNVGDWVFDSVVTQEAGRNLIGPAGDEFDQFITQRAAGFHILEQDPDRRSEYFFRASTRLAQGDLQIVAGEFNDNAPSVQRIEALRSPNPRVTYHLNRMRAFGFSANWVEGSWLFFGEAGLHKDKAVRPNADSFLRQTGGWEQKDQVLAAVGAEYNGFRNLVITLELDSIHTRAHSPFMLMEEDQISGGLRIYWTPLNERWQILGVWNELASDTGRVVRLQADYNWSDNLDLGVLYVDYSTTMNSPFAAFRFNDVFQLQLRYSFDL